MGNYNDFLNEMRAYEDKIKKNKGKSKHELMLELENDSPGYHDKKMAASKKAGELQADRFMAQVNDMSHPNHKAAMEEFADKFYHDREKVRKFFIRQYEDLNDAENMEFDNSEFENKVMQPYYSKATSAQDVAFINKLGECLKTFWKAQGYKKTDDFINRFFEHHPLNKSVPDQDKDSTISKDGLDDFRNSLREKKWTNYRGLTK